VLDLIMAACSNREIAEELGIEERTVKAYVTSLMRKTGVDNRVSLSVRAMQNANRDQRTMRLG
jgi:DNA-binding NarL/FixJ family response regulator